MSAEDNRDQIETATVAAEVQTVEKNAEYQAALEHEKQGYEARLARLADGKQDPQSAERLSEMAAGVDAELARLGHGSVKKPRSRKKKDS